jgi:hypothetical protein
MERHGYARASLEFRNATLAKPDDDEAFYQLALAQLAAGASVAVRS